MLNKYQINTRKIATTSVMALMVATPWISSCASGKKYQEPPFTVPFSIDKAGAKVTSEFKVKDRQIYAVSLQYEYKQGDQADRAKVWGLAGGSYKDATGQWLEPGAPIQTRVTITRLGENDVRPLVETVVQNPRLSSWGVTLNASLVEINLDPGVYRVTAENLQAAPDFLMVRTNLFVGTAHHGK